MPFPLLAIGAASGLSALAGLLSGRKSARTSTQDFTDTENPTFTPEGISLREAILAQLLQRMQSQDFQGTDFSALRTQNISDVNRATSRLRESIASQIAQRGQSFSPAAANPIISGEQFRLGSISDLLGKVAVREAEEKAQLPLIREQLMRQRTADAEAFLPFLSGRTIRRSGTVMGPGSMIGNALGSGASTLFTGLGLRSLGR